MSWFLISLRCARNLNLSMSENWHYLVNNEQQGPVSQAELFNLQQSGVLTPETLVWRDGLANWLPLAEVSDLQNESVVAASESAASGLNLKPSEAAQSSLGSIASADPLLVPQSETSETLEDGESSEPVAAGSIGIISAFVMGAIACVVAGAIWAGITIATGYQIGWIAIGVGFLVGTVIRIAARGSDALIYGAIGAVFAVLACFLGDFFYVVSLYAEADDVGLMTALFNLGNWADGISATISYVATDPMTWLFYGLAGWEGYYIPCKSFGD